MKEHRTLLSYIQQICRRAHSITAGNRVLIPRRSGSAFGTPDGLRLRALLSHAVAVVPVHCNDEANARSQARLDARSLRVAIYSAFHESAGDPKVCGAAINSRSPHGQRSPAFRSRGDPQPNIPAAPARARETREIGIRMDSF